MYRQFMNLKNQRATSVWSIGTPAQPLLRKIGALESSARDGSRRALRVLPAVVSTSQAARQSQALRL